MKINKFLKYINLAWVIRHNVYMGGKNAHEKLYMLMFGHNTKNEKILFKITPDKKWSFGA